MRIAILRRSKVLALVAVCLTFVGSGVAADPELTKEQMKQFLASAKVVGSKQSKKGITNPWRLTLSDGTVTHDASFQSIDERKATMQFANGSTELNFADSYKFNIAAYVIAEMVGLDDIMPVYVERKWQGRAGSVSWWLPVKMDEEERLKRKISAPNADTWNQQMYRIRVFDELVYDSDANLTNVLISEDWKIYRVDFSRAFRLYNTVRTMNLVQCDRKLLEKLKALDAKELAQKTQNYLTKPELQGVMARRDKIVAHFQKLIAEKGEAAVLY